VQWCRISATSRTWHRAAAQRRSHRALFPEGLTFRPAENAARRVWAISGTAHVTKDERILLSQFRALVSRLSVQKPRSEFRRGRLPCRGDHVRRLTAPIH
jgi:hypothetical protein